MSVWDAYRDRLEQIGNTRRDMLVVQAREKFTRQIQESPSCRLVLVDGEEQYLSITHHAESGYKKIAALPGYGLKHGGLVDFAKNKWLITEVDADDQVYQKGVMRQCNHILRWISSTGELREKWCVVEDGTKYLIGEKTREFLTIGDGRMAVTIGKDPETIELCRGLRFLIDDEDSEFVTAYQITKSNKLFNVYNGEGVFRFILNEVQLTDNDNTELRIADYKTRLKEGTAAILVHACPYGYKCDEPEEDEPDTPDDPAVDEQDEGIQGGWL